MNNLIERAVVAGVAFYVFLMILEVIIHPAALAGAVAGAVLLGILASVFLSSHEHAVHIGEMILAWVMILLFVLYGVLRSFGVISWI
ncbi:MAG TPA: hypothetical protein O0X23_02490 [Methanocorpusculum sp.]|nr:hypothetical protein [Methanocorpusculum sp.]